MPLPWRLRRQLLAALRRAFRLDDRTRASIEADTRTATPARLAALRSLGFQGLSYGIQDLDLQVQQAVNRVQPQDTVTRAVARVHELGFESINADLICGLPCQTPNDSRAPCTTSARCGPPTSRCTGTSMPPKRFRSQRRIPIAELPALERRADMMADATTRLQDHGYRWAGIDRFARPGAAAPAPCGDAFPPEGDVIGLGISAVSRLGTRCYQNAGTLADYYEALSGGQLPAARRLTLTSDDLVRRAVMGALATTGSVDLDAIGQVHGLDMPRHFAREFDRLRPLQAAGAVEFDGASLRLTAAGQLVARAVVGVFDRHLLREPGRPGRPGPRSS